MSEFKKGDRVTHAYPEFTETYTVEYTDKALAFVRDGAGVQYSFAMKNLTLVPEAAFKKGDRVRVVGLTDRWNGLEGVATGEVSRPGKATFHFVDIPGERPARFSFLASQLELIVDETPKVGDRVRLVHEGVVTDISGRDSGRTLLIDGHARILGKGETVEILERAPQPYIRGTVALFKTSGALPLIRGTDGAWRNHGGEIAEGVTDKRVRTSGEYKVIHEPKPIL